MIATQVYRVNFLLKKSKRYFHKLPKKNTHKPITSLCKDSNLRLLYTLKMTSLFSLVMHIPSLKIKMESVKILASLLILELVLAMELVAGPTMELIVHSSQIP